MWAAIGTRLGFYGAKVCVCHSVACELLIIKGHSYGKDHNIYIDAIK